MSARKTTSRTKGEVIASRPTSSPLTGKFDVCVKVMLNDEMSDALRLRARELGFGSVSDCLRETIAVFLFGEERLIDLHADRIRTLAKNMARKAAQ